MISECYLDGLLKEKEGEREMLSGNNNPNFHVYAFLALGKLTCCNDCPCYSYEDHCCNLDNDLDLYIYDTDTEKHKSCPLKEF